ncbi:MAG TPA: DNA-3-methyladenine glycosylase [Thermomicrobiales bacterium]|jgi:DNA-3-methyladenine glycosylase II|nr:DNA-3-methyladenine glycosylase [Thermomicrobiales bacterium]
MMTTTLDPAVVAAGVAHLRAVDPTLARAIATVGDCGLTLETDLFFALVDAIVSQQISIKAAATILERVRLLYAPDLFPTPVRLAATPDEDLRAAGCSRAKVVYLKDLSTRITTGALDLDRLHALPDEEVIAELVAVKGIGRWTAEMLLIFSLGRLDVWPVDDLGIVIAVQSLYGLPERPKRKAMLELGEPWRPYRTLAAWYLWQSRRMMVGMPW